MKSPLLALQKALYDRLSQTLSCSVYDAVPQGAAMPYVTIGEDTAIDWSTKLENGQEVTHTLHIWSGYDGAMEVKQITDTVIQAVTSQPLVLEGFYMVVATLDMTEVIRDPDGYRHAVIRFRFKIQEK
jgi:hypothetical protein